MTAPLTIHNAQITTAAVEIKTLTVTGKQVTLAVFRQLVEKPLVTDDGTLNGNPWGIVNYHPDKCGWMGRHMHVVWQDGAELRRSAVTTEAKYEPVFWTEAGSRFYAAAVRHWLTTGEVKYWKGGVFDLFTGQLKKHGSPVNDSYSRRRWVECFDDVTYTDTAAGLRVGFDIPSQVRGALLAELEVRDRIDKLGQSADKEHNASLGDRYCRCGGCAQIRLEEAEDARDEAVNDLTCYIEDRDGLHWTDDAAALDELSAAHWKAITAEKERRDRHAAVRRALADLPQLFIAV